jgi:hypothetical protein
MGTIRFTGVHDDAWTAEDAVGEEADAILRHWDDLGSLLDI